MRAWGVEVNEACVLGHDPGAAWWFAFRQHFDRLERIADGRMSVAGSRAWVLCEDRADADGLVATMVAAGIHATALRAASRPLTVDAQLLLARLQEVR